MPDPWRLAALLPLALALLGFLSPDTLAPLLEPLCYDHARQLYEERVRTLSDLAPHPFRAQITR